MLKDYALMRSHLIIAATVPEDRKALWENPQVLERLGVINKADAVDALLNAGQKVEVINRINILSGFTDEAKQAEAEEVTDLGN